MVYIYIKSAPSDIPKHSVHKTKNMFSCTKKIKQHYYSCQRNYLAKSYKDAILISIKQW